jgi:riboflavin kinase/FMN adenylyltransferase
VLTFEPHPRELFAPDQAPARLASLRDKIELLAECGVDRVHVCRFNRQLAALTAEQFIERILVRGLAVRHLIIGDDFRFGKARGGDFALLQQAGRQHGFAVEAMHTVDFGGLRVSSSAVRDALAAGDIEHAEQLLGRAFVIAGRVMDGKKIGRTIGFPTANIQVRRKRLPLSGVFAVTVSGIDAQAAARRRQHRRAADPGGGPQAGARSPSARFRPRHLRHPRRCQFHAQAARRGEVRIARRAQGADRPRRRGVRAYFKPQSGKTHG